MKRTIYDFNGISTFRGIAVVKGKGRFGFWYREGFTDSVMFEERRQEKIGYLEFGC